MAKFWMNDKKATPAENFGIDVDNDYYSNIGGNESSSFEASDLYGDEFGGYDSDVKVVAPVDDTVYKVLYAPEDCECRGDVVDSLMNGRVVVMNVADLDREQLLRMFDYVMGALQALGGDMKRYGKKVVALFPEGVDPETPLTEFEDEPYEETEDELYEETVEDTYEEELED